MAEISDKSREAKESVGSGSREGPREDQGSLNRWEPVRFDQLPVKPVPVSVGTQPAKIQILNLNLKNEKFPKNS